MLETGRDSATYADLVGPDKYIRRINPVAGEDYTRLVVRAQDKVISVRTKAGKTIKYNR
jgi:hypothetical protein